MGNHFDIGTLRYYERNGFASIENFLEPEFTVELRNILMQMHEKNVGFKEGAQFDAVGFDDGGVRRFPQIINPHQFAPELEQNPAFVRAEAIAKQLLGESARFKADISLLKPAQIGSATPWHQDEAFLDPTMNHSEVSIWIALTDAQVENSCMGFIPGSHQWDVLPHRPMSNDPRIHALECVGDFNAADMVACPLKAGGCTIHNNRTLHYAGPNVSQQDRLAYVLLFDVKATKRSDHREFPWQRAQLTARTLREQQWRRRGGLLVHAWRQRRRIRLSHLRSDLHRVKIALSQLISRQ